MTDALPRLPPEYRLLAHERLASSNDEAKRLAREGAADGTVVWTREQTEGRGRRGRAWVGLEGNLFSSFLLRPACAAAAAAQLGFVAALAVGDTISAVAPAEAALAYKWPNDVLLNGRKVSGILLESEMTAGGALDWLVIGVGLNIARHPAGTERPSSSLAAEGCAALGPGAALAALAAHLLAWRRRWQAEGFAPIRDAWLAGAAGRGGMLTARLERGELRGRFRDLDGDGALLLDTEEGPRRVTAGEIFPVPG